MGKITKETLIDLNMKNTYYKPQNMTKINIIKSSQKFKLNTKILIDNRTKTMVISKRNGNQLKKMSTLHKNQRNVSTKSKILFFCL